MTLRACSETGTVFLQKAEDLVDDVGWKKHFGSGRQSFRTEIYIYTNIMRIDMEVIMFGTTNVNNVRRVTKPLLRASTANEAGFGI